MKLFVLLFVVMLLVTGCSLFGEIPEFGTEDFFQYVGKQCEKQDGNWLADHQECEGITQEWCENFNGRFYQCSDACRHFTVQVQCKHPCVSLCEWPK